MNSAEQLGVCDWLDLGCFLLHMRDCLPKVEPIRTLWKPKEIETRGKLTCENILKTLTLHNLCWEHVQLALSVEEHLVCAPSSFTASHQTDPTDSTNNGLMTAIICPQPPPV